MNYSDTWFAKQPMKMHVGWGEGRELWLHQYVDVIAGDIVPMNRKNPDGSTDVLGVSMQRMSCGYSIGGYNREKMQRSLSEHAERLKAAGATIVKHTKNILVARHGGETAYYVITPASSCAFFRNLNRR